MGHLELLRDTLVSAGGDRSAGGGLRDGFAVGIEDVGPELDRRWCRAVVFDVGRDGDGGTCVVHIGRR